MAARNPLLAAFLALFLLSLAGIPPLVGFASKLYLFALTARAGLIWLVALAVANSALALYYYFRVIRALYDGAGGREVRLSRGAFAVVLLCVGFVVLLGIYPAPLLDIAMWAAG